MKKHGRKLILKLVDRIEEHVWSATSATRDRNEALNERDAAQTRASTLQRKLDLTATMRPTVDAALYQRIAASLKAGNMSPAAVNTCVEILNVDASVAAGILADAWGRT